VLIEALMNIAVIGWGSLIWCPGSLRIKTRWRGDGPTLPIEFARISEDERLTLVIHPGSPLQATYWALSELTDLTEARRNLMEREGCRSLRRIPYVCRDDASPEIPREVDTQLKDWLPKHNEVEAVIWTALETNWDEKFHRDFSPQDAVRYLERLDAGRKRTKVAYERAKEYITNAPPLIQTKVRALMRDKGWHDAKLSDLFFEADGKEKPARGSNLRQS